MASSLFDLLKLKRIVQTKHLTQSTRKQGSQGLQKLGSLNSLKINLPHPILKHGNVPLNHYKWLHYQILGVKTVNNVQIDPQIREICTIQPNV